jgi:hypothetical protein
MLGKSFMKWFEMCPIRFTPNKTALVAAFSFILDWTFEPVLSLTENYPVYKGLVHFVTFRI